MFEIAETAEFRERLEDLSLPEQRRITQKLTDYIYPILRGNPFSGPNIKACRTIVQPRGVIGSDNIEFFIRFILASCLSCRFRKEKMRIANVAASKSQ